MQPLSLASRPCATIPLAGCPAPGQPRKPHQRAPARALRRLLPLAWRELCCLRLRRSAVPCAWSVQPHRAVRSVPGFRFGPAQPHAWPVVLPICDLGTYDLPWSAAVEPDGCFRAPGRWASQGNRLCRRNAKMASAVLFPPAPIATGPAAEPQPPCAKGPIPAAPSGGFQSTQRHRASMVRVGK